MLIQGEHLNILKSKKWADVIMMIMTSRVGFANKNRFLEMNNIVIDIRIVLQPYNVSVSGLIS